MMTEERCKKRVYGGSYMGHQCSRKAVKDGYCKQHHPDTVKAKKETREKQWEKEWAERKRRAERERAICDFTAGMTWDEGLTLAEVREAINQYLRECDNPATDLRLRAHRRDELRAILSRLRTEKDRP